GLRAAAGQPENPVAGGGGTVRYLWYRVGRGATDHVGLHGFYDPGSCRHWYYRGGGWSYVNLRGIHACAASAGCYCCGSVLLHGFGAIDPATHHAGTDDSGGA